MNKQNYLLIFALAGAMNKQYLDGINFLNQEIKVLKEVYKKHRIPLNNDQRRLLAAKFKELDKTIASQMELLVTPETMMLWYESLIAQKWDHSDKKKKKYGRTPLSQDDVDIVLKLLRENPGWGDNTVSNRLRNMEIKVSETSVANIRKRYGIPPAPDREKTGEWDRFLSINWESLVAIDFKVVEVWNKNTLNLDTFYALFAIQLATRKVKCCGITQNPKEDWMIAKAIDLTDPIDGFFKGFTHCIMDNDTIFSTAFKDKLYGTKERSKELKIKTVLTVVGKPNMNAYIERYNLSYQQDALKWVIPQNENHLKKITKEWVEYYNTERNHQGINEQIIEPGNEIGRSDGEIVCKSILGGALNYYYRKSA